MQSTSLWRNRNFRFLFVGATSANLGDGVNAVAVPWLATLLTHDPFLIGLVAAARQLPWFLFALPAGVLTDRLDHRRILISADCLRVLLSLALLVLAITASPGTVPVLAMAAMTFVLGSAEVLRDNTAQTFLPTVVEKPQLEQANGALWATEQLAGQFIGPPLAGFLIGLSAALPFGIQAAMLLGAIGSVTVMVTPRRDAAKVHLPMLASLKEGMLWLWRDRMLRRLAFILGGFNFAGYGFWAVMVLYGQRVLGLDAFGYGAFLTLAACGGLTATFLGPIILKHISPTQAILFGMAVFTLSAGILATQPPLWLAGLVMVIDGFGGMMWNLAQVSYRQRHIPAPLLGRVNSAFRFIGTGPAAFGALAYGALVAWAEPMGATQAVVLPFAVSAAIGAVLTLYAALRLKLA